MSRVTRVPTLHLDAVHGEVGGVEGGRQQRQPQLVLQQLPQAPLLLPVPPEPSVTPRDIA